MNESQFERENQQETTSPVGAASEEPEVVDAEIIELTPEPEPKPENAGTILGAYIDWRRAEGVNGLDDRTKGILARQLRETLAAGHSPAIVKRGLWCWHHSGQHPSTLFSFIDAEARGGRNGHVANQSRQVQRELEQLLASGGTP